tara:strand:+ start:1237 stop:1512 length:276 start_codon:yes stop_codon:yes gene_type:complete
MGLFNLKKNKRYNYTGRFSEDSTPYGNSTNPKKIKSKFDNFRTTIGNDNGFRNKFRNAINDYKKGTDNSVKKRTAIILFLLIIFTLIFFLI